MKKQKFFENAKMLNFKFNITPLLYGSLGLEYQTGENLNSKDIDILIPEIFLNKRWEEFKYALEKEGYTLVDSHEHTFIKDNISFSYASIEELETFAKIKLRDINEYSDNGANFKLMTLKQYLKVYKKSILDGYRINVRKKKDNEKIEFIEKRLKALIRR